MKVENATVMPVLMYEHKCDMRHKTLKKHQSKLQTALRRTEGKKGKEFGVKGEAESRR